MNLTTIIPILDENLHRETISTKNSTNACSWTQTNNFTVTYNETTITECHRICLVNKNNTIKLYINHHNRHKLTTTNLTDISTFSIT